MMGLEMHLVFPYLGMAAMLLLPMMAIGQWVWEWHDTSQRGMETWIDRASDYTVSVAYVAAVLSIPSIYYDAWKAGVPGPNASLTAEMILNLMAVSFTVAVFRVSVKPAIRLWKETTGLPMMNRCLWTLRAVSCPFRGPDVFDAWRKSGRRIFPGT
jgi:hypothetical protein